MTCFVWTTLALILSYHQSASFLVRDQWHSRGSSPYVDVSHMSKEDQAANTPNPDSRQPTGGKPNVKPDILQPFLPASDPEYRNVGPIGEGDFIINREGAPTVQELANENILKIVRIECSDLEVNTLVWKCLGYRFNGKNWASDGCFPNWKAKFPQPPDLIGMQRIYAPEVDKPSLKANQALVRSIPADNKQSLKKHLKPLGWTGYQYAELTPNKTRRAQCANWLIFYREELFGYSVEELRERRQRKKEAESKKDQEDGWKPPVKEVY